MIPGGFGERGIEGKIAAAGYAREHEHPLPRPVPRHAGDDHRLRPQRARPRRAPTPASSTRRRRTRSSTSWRPSATSPTWAAPCASAPTSPSCAPGSQVAAIYGSEVVSERHRHRYEFNPRYRGRFEANGLRCSGTSPDGRLVEFVELDGHPFWVGTQAHPEFKSRPEPARAAVPRVRRAPRWPGPRAATRTSSGLDAEPVDRAGVTAPTGEPPGFRQRRRATSVCHGATSSRVAQGTFAGARRVDVRADVVHHPGAVSVVPLLDDGTVVLVRQYRAAIDAELLEIPAGKRDVDGEAPERHRPARAGRGDRLPRRPPRAAGPVPQLARLLRRGARTIFLGHRPDRGRHVDLQGIEEQHMTVERVPLADVPGADRRRASCATPRRSSALAARPLRRARAGDRPAATDAGDEPAAAARGRGVPDLAGRPSGGGRPTPVPPTAATCRPTARWLAERAVDRGRRPASADLADYVGDAARPRAGRRPRWPGRWSAVRIAAPVPGRRGARRPPIPAPTSRCPGCRPACPRR